MDANQKNTNEAAKNSTENTNEAVCKRPRRRLNPVVKWTLIGLGTAAFVGTVTYLVVKGHSGAAEKVTEATAEMIAAAV